MQEGRSELQVYLIDVIMYFYFFYGMLTLKDLWVHIVALHVNLLVIIRKKNNNN